MQNDLENKWGVLVCWLWRKLGCCVLTKRQLGALAQLQVQIVKTHKNQFLHFWLKQWLLNHQLSMGNDLAKELSALLCWLWRKLGWCVLTKRQLGVLAQLQVQVRQDPQESAFGLLAQAMVVKPSAEYGERFGKRIKCVALLVVKKTWLMSWPSDS